MVVFATVLAFLLLLLLLAERGTGLVWGGRSDEALFYCPPCDMRYPLDVVDGSTARICPRGHRVEPEPERLSLTTLLIVACVAFICVGVLLIAIGRTGG